MEKSEDARKIKDWDAARKHLDDFKTGFYQDRDIREILSIWSSWTQRYKGEKAEKKELELAEDMEKRIKDDQRDPYRRDITEYTPDWKDQMALLDEMLMRAKNTIYKWRFNWGYRDLPSGGSEVSGKP